MFYIGKQPKSANKITKRVFQTFRFKGSKVQNAKFIIDGMFKMYLYYIYIIIYI